MSGVCPRLYVQGVCPSECMSTGVSREYVQGDVCAEGYEPGVIPRGMSKGVYPKGCMSKGVSPSGYVQEFVQVGISMILSISGVYPR